MFTFLCLDLSFGLPTAIQRGLSQVPRWIATVDATLELTHERVDDVPPLLGFLITLQLPEILDRHFPPHSLHQGLSNGWLITVWIAYILSRADHQRLADPAAWEALEAELWQAHCDVYALPVERVRLDATTSCGYHTVPEDGLMQLGHS